MSTGGHERLSAEHERLSEERTAAVELLADALGITEAAAFRLVRLQADGKARECENYVDERWRIPKAGKR